MSWNYYIDVKNYDKAAMSMKLIDPNTLMKDVCSTRCGCMPDECKYNFNGDKYCEPYQYIKYAKTIDAIPLKPLYEWLSLYAAPPMIEKNEE